MTAIAGDRLGDRGDPKDGLLGDRRVRPDIRDTMSVEPRQRPIADHAYSRPAVGQWFSTSPTVLFSSISSIDCAITLSPVVHAERPAGGLNSEAQLVESTPPSRH
jgi:hypothetical protein